MSTRFSLYLRMVLKFFKSALNSSSSKNRSTSSTTCATSGAINLRPGNFAVDMKLVECGINDGATPPFLNNNTNRCSKGAEVRVAVQGWPLG